MYSLIAHASKDENNKYQGGKAGDQTGKEVYIRSWYNRPWNVILRAKDPKVREKIAECAEISCKCNKVGYSQSTRNTLWEALAPYKFDIHKLNKDVNADCSSLVCVCCAYAGVPTQYLRIGNNCLTTRTLRNKLLQTGMFTALTDSKFLTSEKYLLRGDILLYEGHHVAVELNGDGNLKSVHEIALEVIQGKWGDGATRKTKLTQAGYNYEAVRKEVNSILSKPKKSIDEIAQEVIDKKWGDGNDRKNRLTKAGHDYKAVQKKVNELLSKKSVDVIAQEVVDDKWGTGADRKNRLTKEGYDYNEVQKKVNELLSKPTKSTSKATTVNKSLPIIDISHHNTITDWNGIKSSVSGVIMRLGYRGYGNGTIMIDRNYLIYLSNVKSHNIPYGIYFFPTSVNEAEAKEEAQYILNQVEGLDLSFPIYLDSEMSNGQHNGRSDKLDRNTRTKLLKVILDVLKSHGYKCGVYASTSWLNNQLNMSMLSGYYVWVAQYNTKCTYTGKYNMWQYSSKAKIKGVSGNCDVSKLV